MFLKKLKCLKKKDKQKCPVIFMRQIEIVPLSCLLVSVLTEFYCSFLLCTWAKQNNNFFIFCLFLFVFFLSALLTFYFSFPDKTIRVDFFFQLSLSPAPEFLPLTCDLSTQPQLRKITIYFFYQSQLDWLSLKALFVVWYELDIWARYVFLNFKN